MDYKGFIMGAPNTKSINYMDWDYMDGSAGEGEFGALDNFFYHDWDLPMENVDVGIDPNKFGPIPSEIISGFSDQPLFQPVSTLIGIEKELKLIPKCVKDDNHSPEESVVIQTQNYSNEHDTACSDSQSAENSSPLTYDVNFPTRPRSKRARCSDDNPWLRLVPSIVASKTKSNQNKRRRVEYEEPGNNYWQPVANKKCTHCEVTKTPQWREGPMGPKTLCNACGVRYRSGRLLPEYRPAASPTFVPYLHSNSHRKVIAMRNKGKQLHHVRIDEEYPMVENPPFRSWNILDFQY